MAAGRSGHRRTTTSPTARTSRGRAVLLRPEVVINHDGRRELEDWPALLYAYGSGDGAFYTKHVRCGDPLATWLLARRFGRTSAQWLYKLLTRRGNPHMAYLRGMARGVRASFGSASIGRAASTSSGAAERGRPRTWRRPHEPAPSAALILRGERPLPDRRAAHR